MKFIAYIIFFILIAGSFTSYSQSDSTLLRHASASLEKQPATEKVYLHLDKANYGFGDTVWYKAYTVVGTHHQLSALSGVLYVEMISPADSVITRQILKLTSGIAWSSMPLSPTLKQGMYRIRAYTRWMQNTGKYFEVSIRINNSADSIYIKVTANDKLFKERPNTKFYLLAQLAGKVYYTAEGNLTAPVYMAAIDKKRFPSGIAQFTLLDESGDPIAERIAFIQNNDTINLQLNTNIQTYQTRQPVKIALNATGDNKQPVTGSFSVAVINESAAITYEASESTIINDLLLTSDLKGYIENPNYYFINSNNKTKADLDLLMLTQGYRKYEWKQILDDKPANTIYEPEKSLELTGVVKTLSGKTVSNGKINLVSPEEEFFADTTTNNYGIFKFTDLELTDSLKLILRAGNGNKGNNVGLYIKQPRYPDVSSNTSKNSMGSEESPVLKSAFLKANTEYQEQQKRDFSKPGIMLKQVTVRARKIEKPDIYNRYGASIPDFKISGEQMGALRLMQGLQVKLPHAIYRDGKFFSPGWPPEQYHIVINRTEVDPSEILNYDASEIEDVKIIRDTKAGINKILYNVIDTKEVKGDMIVITTKQYAGTDTTAAANRPKEVTLADSNTYLISDPPSGFIIYPFKGFTKTKMFYSPKYNASGQMPDLRSTIYWNPNIITDKDGNASFEYYNNDTKGNYRLVVEGIDDGGNLGRQVYRYKVE